MEFEKLSIPDVILVRPRVFGDRRGYFVETWQEQVFAAAGLTARFVQDNLSRSTQFTLRGLHYQLRQPQGKLVRVVSGTIYDVAVDMRRSSATFGQHVGVVLSEESHYGLWVPPGFAHGFAVLSESAHFVYKCTDFYAPQHERTLQWNDPELAIDWHLPDGAAPVLSARDAAGTPFREAAAYP